MSTKICKSCGEKVFVGGDNEEGTHYYECPKCGPTDAVEVPDSQPSSPRVEQEPFAPWRMKQKEEEKPKDYPCRVKVEFLCTLKGVNSAEVERKGGEAVGKMFKVLQYHAEDCVLVQMSTTYEPDTNPGAPDALPNKP